jgi:hypothetical protein
MESGDYFVGDALTECELAIVNEVGNLPIVESYMMLLNAPHAATC